MSSFLSQSAINTLTGTFDRLWETMSTGRNSYCVIVKEPLKVINNSSSNFLPGYNSDDLNTTDITYTQVTGVFPCITLYADSPKEQGFTQIHTSLGTNEIMLKVKEDAKNYITQGKTENVIINNQVFNINPSFKIQNYFGSLYFYFKCTETQ